MPASAALTADVLVVGGGLAGGPMAIALAQAGLRVVVVDREAPAEQLNPLYDGRASAIALSSKRLLEALDLWETAAPHACPIKTIRVTDRASPVLLTFDHEQDGTDGAPFGWIIENRALRHAIAGGLKRTTMLHVMAPASLADLSIGSGGVAATLDDGTTIRAALVVGAEGRGSFVRKRAGIGLYRGAYDQSAIVCTLTHTRNHENIAWERFRRPGPFALLPLPGGHRTSIVWTEATARAPGYVALSDALFLAEIMSRAGDLLGEASLEGPRWTYPLSVQLARKFTAPRVALVGDAAHGIHPIAGQGLNLGLRDVAALAELVITARRQGLDPGGPALLRRYERWRRPDVLAMVAATDGLTRLFSNASPTLALARQIGLAAVDRLGPAKRGFTGYAMGLRGDLPALLRGHMP